MLNYRCGKRICRKRVTLRHPIEWYIRPPKCKGSCKGLGNLNQDPEVSRRHKKEKCNCGGIMWPHRAKTVLDAHEFCHQLTLEEVELVLFDRDGVELDGPACYLID